MVDPRYRFAPSASDNLDIQKLRTALYAWALSRTQRGDFVLRTADQTWLDGLSWLGIDWDEGVDEVGDYKPYESGKRLRKYRAYVDQLIENGVAHTGNEGQVVLSLPQETAVIQDELRGDLLFEAEGATTIELVNSAGEFAKVFTDVVDDHEMAITHIVCEQSALKQQFVTTAIYTILDFPKPMWLHLPPVVDKYGDFLTGQKYVLSSFEASGYLPEAMLNYLLTLGWSSSEERQLLNKWDIRQMFGVEGMSTTPIEYDGGLLNWFNRESIEKLSNEALADKVRPFLEEAYGALPQAEAWLVRLMKVIRSELNSLEDAIDAADWALDDAYEVTGAARDVLKQASIKPVLSQLIAELSHIVILDGNTARTILNGLMTQQGLSVDAVELPIRAAISGKTSGPTLAEMMGILGKQRCLERVAEVLKQ